MHRLPRLGIAVLFLAAFGLSYVAGCGSTSGSFNVEQTKKIAGELRQNKLYRSAVDEYRTLLMFGKLGDKEKGNVSFLIGKIYFEDLNDYENAAAWFVRAREYDPNAQYNTEVNQNLVASLEKMGHLVDAKREMAAATDIDTSQAPKVAGDVEVARIGDKPVWRSEVEKQMQELPADVQKQLLNPAAKREFVHQYVGVELMYRAAMREGFDRDPEIQRQKEMVLKNLLVQKYVMNKVLPAVQMDTADVKNYYLAHKADRYKSAPLDSVKAEVFTDYLREKREAAYAEYLDKLASGENVQFFDNNVK